jgi:RNA polymerase sigma-70 factor (ECF subfamily)
MDRDITEERDLDLAELMSAIAEGDETAFANLYDCTHAWVFGLVKRIVRDPTAAEEVTLDVYWQVWKSAMSYHRGKGSPVAWIAMLARSRAIDRWRSVQNDWSLLVEDFPIEEILACDTEPAEDASRGQQRADITRALQALGAEQRAVVYLAYFGALSQSEIAERLMLPLGSVKTHARNGLMRLKALLAKHDTDGYD